MSMTQRIPNPSNDPYQRFKQQVFHQIKDKFLNEELVAQMKYSFEELLRTEPIVFTRNEKKRLFQEVLREIVDDILDDN